MGRVKMDFDSLSELYRQALIADGKRYAGKPKKYAPGEGIEEPLLDPVYTGPKINKSPAPPKAAQEPTVEGLEQVAAGTVRLAKNGFFYEAQVDGSWKKIDWFP